MAHLGNTVVNGALRVLGGEYVDTINGATVGSSPKFTDTTYSAGSNITQSGTQFSLTKANVTNALGYTPPTTNTTYTGANGVSLSGTTFSNSGVRAVATGGSNGTINVNTNGSTANVAVKGLGAMAYKASVSKSDVGLGNVANLDQSKAIKSITRSGTTFTATAIDGTTSSFTQQDNNTTYANVSTSAAGLAPKVTDTSKFLKGDGTWATPTNTTYSNVSSASAGLAPKITNTANFLKGDGTWTMPTKANVGLGNVANYDQSKAIKSITRSGTTFTATALDGTTSSFTQQDNNTTYANVSTSAAGLAPKVTSTSAFLKGDGTWATPANTTYSNVSTSAAGLAPKITDTSKFLKGDGTWATPTNTTYSNVSSASAGLAPKGAAVSSQSQSTKFLREDGSWAAPSYTTNTDTKVKVNNTAPTSGTWYYPTWYTSTSGTGTLNANDGFMYYNINGTASAIGHSRIQLGNATGSGTAGNKDGMLRLYGTTNCYGEIQFNINKPTADRTYYLPDKSGTFALDSDISTLQSNFQAGVDSVYNAIVAQGTTPASKSLSDVVTGIGTLSTNRYSAGWNAQNLNWYGSLRTQKTGGSISLTMSAMSPGRYLVITTSVPNIKNCGWSAGCTYSLSTGTVERLIDHENKGGSGEYYWAYWVAIVNLTKSRPTNSITVTHNYGANIASTLSMIVMKIGS